MTHGGAVRRARSCALLCLLVLIRVAEYTPRVGVVKCVQTTELRRNLTVILAERRGA